MKIENTVRSECDKVTKTVFTLDDGLTAEFSLIDNGTGKHIVCVPSQTSCNMGCKFCHASEMSGIVPCRDLTSDEILEGVGQALSELGEAPPVRPFRKVLISFMGCGEPLDNADGVIKSIRRMCFDQSWGHAVNTEIRFAISTMVPKKISAEAMFELYRQVAEAGIDLKVHFSLHYTIDEQRKRNMPAASSIAKSIELLDTLCSIGKVPIEVHYSLMEGINDSKGDANRLVNLLSEAKNKFSVKFLNFNEKDGFEAKGSPKETISMFLEKMTQAGIPCETYTPPGIDIGSSCGQFAVDTYIENAGNADSQVLAKSLCDYIAENPNLRFWQAVRNWSGHDFIYVSKDLVEDDRLTDTFYRREK